MLMIKPRRGDLHPIGKVGSYRQGNIARLNKDDQIARGFI